MKEIHIQNTLNEFFGEFKKLPYSYKIEKVHQLLNNPYAKALHKVHSNFKPLKIIIMTSAILISVSAIFLWLNPESSNKNIITKSQSENPVKIIQKDISYKIETDKKQYDNVPRSSILNEAKNNDTKIDDLILAGNVRQLNVYEKETDLLTGTKKKDIIGTNWPADTVLEGNKLFVTLTDEELLKLGIDKKGDSVYYCNVNKNGYRNRFTNFKDLKKNHIKEDTTNYSFFSLFQCDFNFNNHQIFGHFNYNMIDTLLPVIIQFASCKEMWWFTTNDDLFNVLPERYKYLKQYYTELKRLKKENGEHFYVNYFDLNQRIQEFRQFNFLDLTDKELRKIGFEFIQDSVRVKSFRDEYVKKHQTPPDYLNGYNDSDFLQRKTFKLDGNEKYNVFSQDVIILDKENHGGSVRSISLSSMQYWGKTINPIPKLISDTMGITHRTFWGDSSDLDYNTLIPVKIDLEKYNFEDLIRGRNEYIFWYEANEDFTSRLSSSLGIEIQNEYEAIKNKSGQIESSCTYFEVCKSTLQLDNFKLYPNPASNLIAIEFDTKENLFGNVTLVNIAGMQLKTLIPNTTFTSGYNSHQMNVSGIVPGIYLISVNTDKGFKTQRLIITQ